MNDEKLDQLLNDTDADLDTETEEEIDIDLNMFIIEKFVYICKKDY